MHLDEGALQALLDEGFENTAHRTAAEHVADCADCSARLEELRALSGAFSAAVALLDDSARVERGRGAVAVRARRPQVIPLHRRFATSSLARAAVLLLVFAAAASATIPGSPVRRWISELFASSKASPASTAPAAPTRAIPGPAARTPAVTIPEPIASGVSVRPANNQLVVSVARSHSRLRVVIVPLARALVTATVGAADVQFQTAPGRVDVVGGSAGEVRIELPRGTRAFVRRDGSQILEFDGSKVITVSATRTAVDEYTFPAAPTR